MSKQRLYHSNFNHNGWKKKKGEKSRAHNLRADLALDGLYMGSVVLDEICDPDLIKNNKIYIDRKLINPLEGDKFFKEITDSLESEKKEYLEKLESSYSDSGKAELSGLRAKAKAALKRYSASSGGAEKDFWDELTDRLGKEEINPETELARLQATGKVTRYNQKSKRIEELGNYNPLIGVKSRNTELTIFSKEMLYKIPDSTDLKVSALDMANFSNAINKKLYPDFRCTYIAIHCDENPERPHAHVELSGKNLKTGEMDINQQLFLNLKKEYQLKNKHFPLPGESYNDLTYDEVVTFGEVYQDYIYEEMNKYLQKKGYDAKLEKRTTEEKIDDKREFLDQKKPTQKREHTRAKKLKEENENLNTEVVLKEKKVLELSDKVKWYETVIDQSKKTLEGIKAGIKAAFSFSKSSSQEDLLDYSEAVKDIEDIKLKRQLSEDAENIQPTQKQKDEIRKTSIRSMR